MLLHISPASFAARGVLGASGGARPARRACGLASDEPWLADLHTDCSAASYAGWADAIHPVRNGRSDARTSSVWTPSSATVSR